MSLAALALRICCVKALTGATSAGARVYDSDIEPRDLAGNDATPVVLVYTDAGKMNVDGLDLLGCTHTVDLTIDSFVARRVELEAGEGAARVSWTCEPTDAGHELYLGLLGYEITRALLGPSAWADLWRRVAYRASTADLSEWDRGAHAEKGVRFAIRRLLLRIETVCEPTPGAPIAGVWADFIAACEADAELAELGAYLRALITSPAAPVWRQAQAALGLSDAAARSIGLSPLDDTQEADTPPATQASFEIDDSGEVVASDSSDGPQ